MLYDFHDKKFSTVNLDDTVKGERTGFSSKLLKMLLWRPNQSFSLVRAEKGGVFKGEKSFPKEYGMSLKKNITG